MHPLSYSVSPEFYWLAVMVVTVISAARLTRLALFDKYPPVAYFRDKFIVATDKTPKRREWQWLAYCPYCAAPWLALLVLGSGYFAGVYGNADAPFWAFMVWWFVNGWMAVSYLAAIFMVRDSDPEDDDSDDGADD